MRPRQRLKVRCQARGRHCRRRRRSACCANKVNRLRRAPQLPPRTATGGRGRNGMTAYTVPAQRSGAPATGVLVGAAGTRAAVAGEQKCTRGRGPSCTPSCRLQTATEPQHLLPPSLNVLRFL